MLVIQQAAEQDASGPVHEVNVTNSTVNTAHSDSVPPAGLAADRSEMYFRFDSR